MGYDGDDGMVERNAMLRRVFAGTSAKRANVNDRQRDEGGSSSL